MTNYLLMGTTHIAPAMHQHVSFLFFKPGSANYFYETSQQSKCNE